MGCEDCSKINIPDKLCDYGKPKPVDFDKGNELIYRRHPQVGTEYQLKSLPENEIGTYIFKLEDDSYNRSYLSNQSDVLLNDEPDSKKGEDYYKTWGIISVPVDEVNHFSQKVIVGTSTGSKEQLATMKVVHTSKKCNYSHCEIFCYLDGQKTNGKPPKSARPLFRRSLQKMLKLHLEYKKAAN